MRVLAASVLILALSAPAFAQTRDANGVCRGPDGKRAKASVCAPARPKKKAADDGASAFRCRDVRTHRFTKCGGPYAEPVPAE